MQLQFYLFPPYKLCCMEYIESVVISNFLCWWQIGNNDKPTKENSLLAYWQWQCDILIKILDCSLMLSWPNFLNTPFSSKLFTSLKPKHRSVAELGKDCYCSGIVDNAEVLLCKSLGFVKGASTQCCFSFNWPLARVFAIMCSNLNLARAFFALFIVICMHKSTVLTLLLWSLTSSAWGYSILLSCPSPLSPLHWRCCCCSTCLFYAAMKLTKAICPV